MTTDDADRIPEPDDVEWSTSMAWNPRDDIVPFRPEESLAWRLGALRRDAAQLRQETAAQSGDNTARLRRLGLLTGGLRDLAEVNDSIVAQRTVDDRVDAAQASNDVTFPDFMAQAVRAQRLQYGRIVDTVARRALELDPSCTMEFRPSPDDMGEDVRVLLSTGGYVPSETVAEWVRESGGDVLAVDVERTDGDTALGPLTVTMDFPVPVGMADWLEQLMDSMLRSPEPTPDTFLARSVQQAARQDPDVPGIQFWNRVHQTADILPPGSCSQDTVNIRTGGPGQPWRREDGTPTSSWRDIDPGTTFRDRLQENAGQEFTDRLLERYGELVRSPQFLFGPEEWAAYQQGVREDYERTTGLRWGATSANGNDVRVVASVDPAVSDPASGATAWAIPLDADGNPTGTPRTLGLVGPVTWEAEPDVRGGHL